MTFNIVITGLIGTAAWLVLDKTPIQSLEVQQLAAENIAKLSTSFAALTARRLPAAMAPPDVAETAIAAPVLREEPPVVAQAQAQAQAQEEQGPAAPKAEAGVQRKAWGAWAWFDYSAWLGAGGGARTTTL